MKSIVTISLVIIVIMIIDIAFYKKPISFSGQDKNPQLENISQSDIDKSVSMINDNLPSMLDKETELMEVSSRPMTMIYKIKMINYMSSQFDRNFLTNAISLISKRNCSDQDIIWGLNHGVSMQYIIYANDDKKVGSFYISKYSCEKYQH